MSGRSSRVRPARRKHTQAEPARLPSSGAHQSYASGPCGDHRLDVLARPARRFRLTCQPHSVLRASTTAPCEALRTPRRWPWGCHRKKISQCEDAGCEQQRWRPDAGLSAADATATAHPISRSRRRTKSDARGPSELPHRRRNEVRRSRHHVTLPGASRIQTPGALIRMLGAPRCLGNDSFTTRHSPDFEVADDFLDQVFERQNAGAVASAVLNDGHRLASALQPYQRG